ncbi:GAS2-like protein 2A isoform X2 [Triplophysa dalaica]|nr:GAS2-like protein 2A isoform X2 [Triplophysa dalaica]
MFETDDLVLRKNEKNFVLCLLEVARRASRFGMASPVLIQLEQEIEEEIREEMEETIQPKPQRSLINTQNLDEMVKFLISRCTCPSQFPMVKVSDGKYRVGDSNTLIFVRILRNHVMVRVGGGWDTLEHYLDKHDPCLCSSFIHKLTQRPATPVHEIKERLTTPQSDAQCGSQTTLLLSRSQSPLQPVVWSSSSPYRTQRAGPSPPRSHYSPDPEHQPNRRRNSLSPNKLRERPSSPSHMHTCTDSKYTRITDSSSRKGREATRSSPTPRLSTSLPRASYCPTTPQPEIQRPQTLLVLQSQPLQGPEKNLGQTWTKLHFVSKLRQNSSTGVKGRESQDKRQLISNGKDCVSPGIQSWLPKPPNITIKEPEDNGGPQRSLGLIHKFSPTKELTGVISDGLYTRPRTPTKKSTGDCFINANEKTEFEKRRNRSFKVQSQIHQVPNMVSPSHVNISSNSYRSVPDSPKSKTGGKEGGIKGGYRYTPSPLSPAQEANLYKSLEEEILSNLQQLSIESDTNSSSDENLAGTPQRSGEISSDRCKVLSPKNHEQTARIHSSTSHKPNSDHGASFDAVVAELSSAQRKMEKASAEKWVTTLPAGLNGKVEEDNTASFHLKVSKPEMTASCSSLGSSMDSKDTGELVKVSMDGERKMPHGKASTEYPKMQKSSLLKRRRSLKKPERVPSIYKLKLRPCVQPRRDHRSDRKPSKIPKPVFYKKISCKDESCPRQRENDFSIESFSSEHGNTWTKPKSHAQVQSAKKCQRTNPESHANHDLESWV